MRTSILLAPIAVAGLSLGACASDPYGYDDNRQLERAAGGAAIGAAGGAAVGAVVDGVSVGEGAAVGAVAGGAIGAVTANDRRWYRDDRGYCFYMRDGRRIYDYDRRDC